MCIRDRVNLKHFKEVNIGSAFVHADSFIAISHLKGHEATGFGGVFKNVGMGCGSRSGKQQMHSGLLPKINAAMCKSCKKCVIWCPTQAIYMDEDVYKRQGWRLPVIFFKLAKNY